MSVTLAMVSYILMYRFVSSSFVCELVCECVRTADLCRVGSVSKMNYDIDLLFIASY